MERKEKLNVNDGKFEPANRLEDSLSYNTNMSDYIINSNKADRVVYCRLGQKYICDLEKKKNSVLQSGMMTENFATFSFLINIKKLVDEHNIAGEKRDFKALKGNTMAKNKEPDPEPYYKPTSEKDRTLVFESRFESGNLLAALKITESEYDLILGNDINTNGHTQWYFFRVGNTKKGQKVTINIVNLAKADSLYNYGMKILCFSERMKEANGTGWHRTGEKIAYYQNEFKRQVGQKFNRNYYTLTFTHTFEYDDDQLFFAHCFPYTYSDLQEDMGRIEKDTYTQNFCHRTTLCRTLAGNRCEYLTITSRDKDPKGVKSRAKRGVVISARVHPGESNSSWMMRGVIEFLVSKAPEAKVLRENFVFKIIPMLNPDGVINGNYRCSLAG